MVDCEACDEENDVMTKIEGSPIVVSIRCCTYNHAPYIRQCLEGFVMQKTNFRFEAIVHDDASMDGTADIIREYAAKYPDIIKPIYERENQYSKFDGSLRRIMNAHMHGKYVALCEGDDYWIDPLKLQKQVDFLEANPEYGLVYTKSVVYYQRSGRFSKPFGGELPNTFSAFLSENRVPTQSVMYKRSLYVEYELDIGYHPEWRMGDYPIYLWFTVKSKVYFLPEVTSVYRCLKNSASHFTSRTDWIRFRINAFDISRYFAERFAPELLRIPESKLLWLHYELAFFDSEERKNLNAFRYEIKEKQLKPNSNWEALLLRFWRFPNLIVLFYQIKIIGKILFRKI